MKKRRKFLAFSFPRLIQDYMTKKLLAVNSGWRTLAEISRETRPSLYSVYARGGGIGHIMTELKRRV
jgi:hypothetical protein